MLNTDQARDRAATLVERALRLGADAADATFHGSAAEAVTMRLGRLEDVERSESEQVALRLFVGQRSASIGSSDLSDAALDELAERALAMARLAPADPFAGLAPAGLLAPGPFQDLDLEDPVELDPDRLRDLAGVAEAAAMDVPGITNSNGATATSGREVTALVTSHGFAGAYAATSRAISVSVIGGEGAEMQRDYAIRSARHLADLPGADSIGQLAGQRTVARLSPGRMRSSNMPAVFDPRVSGGLIGHLLGAMSGTAIARKASFLIGKDAAQIFSSDVQIHENPLEPRGLAARPFDGEGLGTAPRQLVRNGCLTGWLMHSAAARQLGDQPTGHATRGYGGTPGIGTGNVYLAAGTQTPAELIADIADGIYITELFGQGVNGVTGDYSRGASGFRILNGQIAGPVAEFTVAGNLLDMFAALVPANDLERYRSIDAPTVRIDGMTVAGE